MKRLMCFAVLLLPFGAGAASAQLDAPPADESVANRYASPQTLVVVESTRRLNAVCMGQGSPVVVLQSGAGDSSAVWYKVQPKIAEHTRVCAYDRAGYGYSDPSPAAVDPEETTKDLKRLLEGMDVHSPVVLVGHSLGGLYVEHFAGEHPTAVAGVVLVDPTGLEDFRNVRDMLADWPEEQARLKAGYLKRMQLYQRCADLARTNQLKSQPPTECLHGGVGDPTIDRARAAQWTMSTSWPTFLAEMENFYPPNHPMGVDGVATLQVRRHPMALGDKPLILLRAGGTVPPGDRGKRLKAASEAAADNLVASASSNGRTVSVPSGHYVHLARPDLVIDAVNEVVAAVRGNSRP